ncbi:MAG TPA: PadR family transcriptional regulator [Solirubrobacteraceae bacterium]|jgi:DNA-binding PadR family transcriptional regulator
MRGTSASLRGALLGLLLERPGHSYELANRLLTRLGETWRINPNDVYRLLKQLEDGGLASANEEPKRGNQRGTHSVYYPTELTAEALTRWMETLLPRGPVRVGLQAKLAVAREEDAPRLLAALRQYERECLDLLKLAPAAHNEQRSWKALFMDCTREAVDGQLRQEIAWSQRTRRRIKEHATV